MFYGPDFIVDPRLHYNRDFLSVLYKIKEKIKEKVFVHVSLFMKFC